MANLILYCDIVYKKLEQGELRITLLLDIAKAFDSISHNIILYKIKSFLNNVSEIGNSLFLFKYKT